MICIKEVVKVAVNDAVAKRVANLLAKKYDTVSSGTKLRHTTRSYAVDNERKKKNGYFANRNDACKWFWNDRSRVF